MKDFSESKLVAQRGHLKYLEELRGLSRNNRTKAHQKRWVFCFSSLRGAKQYHTQLEYIIKKPLNKLRGFFVIFIL
jgi:hypothetical protein